MRKSDLLVAAAGGVLLAVAGCESSGLSPREVRGQDYATYVFSMTDPLAEPGARSPGLGALSQSSDATKPAKPLQTPAKIAVAQLGEVAPPAKMLDELRKDQAVFASVQPIPGLIDVAGERDVRGRPQDFSAQQSAQQHLERMRHYARDIGADYLFIYGGTVDHATTASPLILANATIIGAFIVPGEVIQADARASGSLIDVETGRVVLSVSSDAADRRRASSVAKAGDEIKMLESLRNELVTKLADQLRDRIREHVAIRSPAGAT